MTENESVAKIQEPIEVVFKIEPKPKARPRMTRSGHTYTPKETKDFENALKLAFKSAYKGKPLTGPVSIDCELFFTRPKKSKYDYPSKCDADNCFKAVADALNGLAWIDDRQLCSIVIEKAFAPSGNLGYISVRVSQRHPGFADSCD